MSPLTKAFVVLVTVLSILLVALVVPFVANVDDLRGDIDRLEGTVAAAQATAAQKTAEVERLNATANADNQRLQDRVTALLGENAELTQQLTNVRASLADAESRVERLNASLGLAQQTTGRLTSLVEGRTQALAEAQSSNVELRKENAQLVQRNNELDSQVVGLNRTVRTLREKTAALEEQLRGEGAATASADTGGNPITSEVRGSVAGVQQVADGITLVQLDVGSNDQLRQGTQLVIFRDDQYVGTATVQTVDENNSVARVDDATMQVRSGDGVMTGIRY